MTGYRTIIFNLIMALAAVARIVYPEMIPTDEELSKFFDAIWAVVMVGGNLGLRVITKGPVGVKDPEVCNLVERFPAPKPPKIE
jgi:hypothetical protein